MKRIRKSTLSCEDDLQRIYREISIMQTVDNIYTVSTYCGFQTRECLYYIMEFAGGGELFGLLRDKGKLLETIVQQYAAELVLALDSLHAAGIIHGDLKPENVLIGENGHVLLADFGSSQYKGQKCVVRGTREYLAPEAIVNATITEAVDWWALVI